MYFELIFWWIINRSSNGLVRLWLKQNISIISFIFYNRLAGLTYAIEYDIGTISLNDESINDDFPTKIADLSS